MRRHPVAGAQMERPAACHQLGVSTYIRTYVPISAGESTQRRLFINSAISKFMLVYLAKQNSKTAAAVDNGYHQKSVGFFVTYTITIMEIDICCHVPDPYLTTREIDICYHVPDPYLTIRERTW